MKIITRTIAGILILLVVALWGLSMLGGTPLADLPLVRSLGAGAGDAILNSSGLKGKTESILRGKVSEISSATGLSEDEVSGAIDKLDISAWKVIPLPSGARKKSSFVTTYQGMKGTVTTYEDPSYVTVNAYGQDLTLAVPDSAQAYVPYLSYLS